MSPAIPSYFPRRTFCFLSSLYTLLGVHIIQKTKTTRHSTSTVLAIPKYLSAMMKLIWPSEYNWRNECKILVHKPEEKMITVFGDVISRLRTNLFRGNCCLHSCGFLIVTSMGTSTNVMGAFVGPRSIRVIL